MRETLQGIFKKVCGMKIVKKDTQISTVLQQINLSLNSVFHKIFEACYVCAYQCTKHLSRSSAM